ncbi:FecR domain-containing protein [Rapidithrix thailandica]|uniref:FecR domain-containing protein n=1 Tax=Rapidithrix thailandica TaxID=413964 RepID=A0AAW9SBR6_9BACT
MKNLLAYEVEDFLNHEGFRQWVLSDYTVNDANWQTWLKAHPEKAKTVEDAALLLNSIEFKTKLLPHNIVEAEWRKVHSTINQVPPEKALPYKNRFLSVFNRKIAAGITGLLLMGSLLFYFLYTQQFHTVSTHFGHKKEVRLPDGSVVVLNANSELKYVKNWKEAGDREVWLTGEAYFKVTPTPAIGRPKFTVHTEALNVEVLGTQFNVQSRTHKTRVVLTSGKIKIRFKDSNQIEVQEKQAPVRTRFQHTDTLVVLPGELIESSDRKDSYIKKATNPELYSSWQNDYLVFENTPLLELSTIINDTYGLHVSVAPEIAQRKLTGKVPSDNVKILLDAISVIFDLQVSVNRKTNTINISETKSSM